MDFSNFLGDVETITELYEIKNPKHGDSVYVVRGGHLYLAVQTELGIDWKQLRVGKGSRGPVGERGQRGLKGIQGEPGLDGKDGRDGADGKDGKDGRDGINGRDGKDGKDGKQGVPGRDGVAIAKDGQPGRNGKDGEDGAGWDDVFYNPSDGRFHFTSQSHPHLNYSSPPLHIPFFGLSLQEIADKLKPYL